ncbi:MAG: FtsX-like permease family protein [Candidatus Cloacimonetes bacterium]|nr:FtsX-like permease family protein [Candidatus Cloacimonadota bacterium]
MSTYYTRLARTYLRSENRKSLSFENVISVIGIFLGVFALIVVMSVMNGLEDDITERIIGLHSEIKIFSHDYSPISNWQQIENKISDKSIIGISPIVQAELMLLHDKKVSGTICQGIELARHDTIANLMKRIYIGAPNQQELEEGIIIGSDLALILGVNWGDELTLSSPIADQPTPFGLMPKSKALKVVGLFYTGIPEYDMKYSYTDLRVLQQFQKMDDRISYLGVKTTSPKKSLHVAKHLRSELGNSYNVLDWREFEKHLFTAIRFEKKIMFLVLVLIFLIAAFNMIGNYLKLVAQKRQDIGILKSFGAKKKDVMKIFIYNGLYIYVIGTLAGFVVSLGLLFAQMKWQFIQIPLSGMPFQSLPVKIEVIDLVLVAFVSLAITLLTTLIPARRTMNIEAIKVIQEAEE